MRSPSKTPRRRSSSKSGSNTDANAEYIGGEFESDRDDRLEQAENEISQQSREIGYQKPPSAHRWPKGRSGNPAGRKKGGRNKRTVILQLMEQKLGRKIEDPSKLSRYEALLLKGIQKALSGDIKAMAYVVGRYDKEADAQGASEHTASERDEIVYAALVEKIRRELKEAG